MKRNEKEPNVSKLRSRMFKEQDLTKVWPRLGQEVKNGEEKQVTTINNDDNKYTFNKCHSLPKRYLWQLGSKLPRSYHTCDSKHLKAFEN
jgi:hypothetical protein